MPPVRPMDASEFIPRKKPGQEGSGGPGKAGPEPSGSTQKPPGSGGDGGATPPGGQEPPRKPGPGRHAKMPPISQLKGRPLGRILIKMGKLNRTQVGEALELQKKKHGPIGQLLIELGYVDDNDVRIALGAQAGMEPVDLSKFDIPREILSLIPAQMAQTYRVVPVDYEPADKTLTIAMDDPSNFQATDDLKTLMGYKIKASITTPDDLAGAMARFYPEDQPESINDLISEIAGDEELAKYEGRGESIDLDELKELAESNPVKKLLNLVLLQAIRDKASDIHFEPFEDEFKMRYRIDGVLYEMVPPPRHIAVAIASRIKVMANLNIAERRLPQDGRIELVVAGNPIDLRVSVLPTLFSSFRAA